MKYEDLKKRQFNTKSISNCSLEGVCKRCNNEFKYSSVKKFMRNRKNKLHKKQLWQTCAKCWLVINTSEDKEWIKKNS